MSAAIKALRAGIATLRARMEHDHEGTAEQAAHIRDEDLPPLNAVRAAADELETLVADDLWPIATYQEMLPDLARPF